MCKTGGFIQKDILYNKTLERLHCRLNVVGIGIGLGNILTLAIQAFEISTNGSVKHIGNTQTGLRVQFYLPLCFKKATYLWI